MNRFHCGWKRPVEPVFVRPNNGGKVATATTVVVGKPLVTSATPATLYAENKTETVDLSILNKNQVEIPFTSSGTIPKIEAELKANSSGSGTHGTTDYFEPTSQELDGYTVQQLKDYLTSRNVEFSAGDNKAALLEKAKNYAARSPFAPVVDDDIQIEDEE